MFSDLGRVVTPFPRGVVTLARISVAPCCQATPGEFICVQIAKKGSTTRHSSSRYMHTHFCRFFDDAVVAVAWVMRIPEDGSLVGGPLPNGAATGS